MAFYDPAEGLTRSEWDRWVAARLAAVVTVAAETPAGRDALRSVGVPPEDLRWPDDLPRLPLLKKDVLPELQAVRPPFAGWNAVPVGELRRIYVSPGPIYDPEYDQADYWGFAPALHAAGFHRGDIVLNTFAYHLTPAGHMFDGALAALGCAVIPGGTGNTDVQARTIADLRVRGYIGTPSFLATLLERPEVRESLRVAFVSGEMLTDRLRTHLEGHGAQVAQGYATADVGLIAYECEARDGLHLSPRVFVEIIDVESGRPCPAGEAGEVVLSFLNDSYPLLRLATGDVSMLDVGVCRCGRGSPRLTRMLGRVGEAVKVRGMFVHPNEVRRAMALIPQVGRYQLVVTRDGHQDRLTARVELESGASPDRISAEVGGRLRDAVKVRVDVEIVTPGSLAENTRVIVDERRWE